MGPDKPMRRATVLVGETNRISIFFANSVSSTPGSPPGNSLGEGALELGHTGYTLTLEPGEFSPMEFFNCQVNGFPGGNVVDLVLDLQSSGGEPAQDCDVVFTASLQGFFRPNDMSTNAPVLPGPLTLRAQPSVTTAATRLQLSSPVPQSTVLQLFDLRGRLVRSMALGAGFDAVRWDGRDGRGSWLASGIYYARVMGHPATATKITIVR